MTREKHPAIELKNIRKAFPGVLANDDVSLQFHSGEIHALLGENGAGKSTLISMLSGLIQPDDGKIFVHGKPVIVRSPKESLNHGIGTVFQHVLLVPTLTVIENLMLGGGWLQRFDRAASLKRFGELSETLAVNINPDTRVSELALGQQQQVEIMRALWRDEGVLILDEPTSMLTPQGVHELSQVMRRLRDNGVALIFVTHKLKEAYDLCDRISVLRLGRVVGDIPPARLRDMSEQETIDEVISTMFDREEGHDRDAEVLLGDASHHGQRRTNIDLTSPIFSTSHISTTGNVGECHLHDINLEVYAGEVFGIAGIDGNGQKHLAEVLAGQRPASAGRIHHRGIDITATRVPERRGLGINYLTDERLGEGTAATHSVATNLVLKSIGDAPHWRWGVTRWDSIYSDAREKIRKHDIRTPSEHTLIGRLSGGNIQKILLAREISEGISVAIFNKPTYGLDLQNIRLARDRISEGAAAGIATILISTELDELTELCDRIGVMYQGNLVGIVQNDDGAEKKIGLLMTGAAAA
ncbi:MAG: ABC transporter ATP-binding protein [Rhodospirillaceae bacterium]|nr:ABC transporter ATP-binding protein [Rhodospirillaceae bacterium]